MNNLMFVHPNSSCIYRYDSSFVVLAGFPIYGDVTVLTFGSQYYRLEFLKTNQLALTFLDQYNALR